MYFHNCYGTLYAYDGAIVACVDDDVPELPINITPFNLTDGVYNGTVRMFVSVSHQSEDVVEVEFADRVVTYRK